MSQNNFMHDLESLKCVFISLVKNEIGNVKKSWDKEELLMSYDALSDLITEFIEYTMKLKDEEPQEEQQQSSIPPEPVEPPKPPRKPRAKKEVTNPI